MYTFICPDSYRGKVGNREMVKCRKQGGNVCPFVYWCENAQDWKPIRNTQETCLLRTKINKPDNASVVRFIKKGKLYIEYKDGVVVLDNPFNFVPKYVTLIHKGEKFYIDKKKGFA